MGNIVPAKMHIASSLTGIPKPADVRQKKYTNGGVVDRTDVIESVDCESACIRVAIDENREGDDDIWSAVFLLVDLDVDRCDVNVGMRDDILRAPFGYTSGRAECKLLEVKALQNGNIWSRRKVLISFMILVTIINNLKLNCLFSRLDQPKDDFM